MELHYVDRTTFRTRETDEFLSWIKEKFGNVYVLPVGGTNTIALKGCAEIIDQIEIDYNYICSASGSGGTFAGLVAGLDGKKKAIAFPALKGGEFLEKVISDLVYDYTGKSFSNWSLNTDYHFGGFAKLSKELIDFTHKFNELNGFELDYIYTNKMMFGIADLIKKSFFKPGESIVAIHSGGLQGNVGIKEKVEKLLNSNN
jgi:1-aminocyclopropane-1-carboxylate deaminase/D-cysteine desulfhydrase-like pyridoxal-dependent ACC family enzyme